MIYWFILTLPFTAFAIFQFAGRGILLNYFLGLIFFTMVLIHLSIFSKKKYQAYFDSSLKFFFAFMVFLLAMNLIGFSHDPKFLTQFINIFIIFASYFALLNIFSKFQMATMVKLANFFLMICFVFSIFSIYQFFSIKLSLPTFDFYRNSEMYYVAREAKAASGWTGGSRVHGVAPEPSFWAAFILVPISILLPSVLKRRVKSFYLISFIILNISFILAMSRSSWLTYLMILIIYFLVFRLKIKVNPYFLVVLSILIVLFSSALFFFSPFFRNLSFYMRVVGEMTSIQMFLNSPLFGFGWGSFQTYFLTYRYVPTFAQHWISQLQFNMGFSSNFYLRLLAETGVVGLGLFMGMILTLYNKFYRLLSTRLYKDNPYLCQGLFLAYYSILISWFNLEAFNMIYIWFIFAIMAVLPNCQSKEELNYKANN